MKRFPFLVFLAVAFSTLSSAYSQKITAVVADEVSRQTVADVFVFYDNSSTGTITDATGKFELTITDFQNATLVFSHLNYELKTMLLEGTQSFPDTIFLTPSSTNLTEAIVVERAKPRIRKRWLKRFTKEFLGEEHDPELVKIVNPEVLLFEVDKGNLSATVQSPLFIENKLLGYTVQFFLESFESFAEGDLLYSGKVFFEEMAGSKKETARFKRNRFKTYQQTSRSFFANLVQQKLTDEDYEVGYSIFNNDLDFSNYEPIAIDSIMVNKLPNDQYEITLNRILTVTNRQLKVGQQGQKVAGTTMGIGEFKQTTNNIPKSYFWSKYGRIVLNKNGVILNPTEVEEAGYWANFRVATLLPLDYKVKQKRRRSLQ